MKRIYISSYDCINNPYYGGGGARAIHHFAKRLSNDFKITVLCGNYKNATNECIDDVEYKKVGFKFLGPFMGQIFFQIFLPLYVLMNKGKFDLWIESFTPPYSTAFTPLFTRKPVIGLCFQLNGIEMKAKFKLPFDLIEKLGIKLYKNIICINEKVHSKISAYNPKADVQMIPCGIDKELLEIDFVKEEKYLLFLGRIDLYHKGLDMLVEIYKRVSDKIQYKLLIAGGGPEEQVLKLKELIKNSNLEDKITLLGKVSEEEKVKLFQQSLAFLIPSRFEGFGIVALEAFALNTPTILFDIEGFDWISENCTVKIPPYNLDLFSERLINICNNPIDRHSISNNARRFSESFTWNEIADKYKNIINKII